MRDVGAAGRGEGEDAGAERDELQIQELLRSPQDNHHPRRPQERSVPCLWRHPPLLWPLQRPLLYHLRAAQKDLPLPQLKTHLLQKRPDGRRLRNLLRHPLQPDGPRQDQDAGR